MMCAFRKLQSWTLVLLLASLAIGTEHGPSSAAYNSSTKESLQVVAQLSESSGQFSVKFNLKQQCDNESPLNGNADDEATFQVAPDGNITVTIQTGDVLASKIDKLLSTANQFVYQTMPQVFLLAKNVSLVYLQHLQPPFAHFDGPDEKDESIERRIEASQRTFLQQALKQAIDQFEGLTNATKDYLDYLRSQISSCIASTTNDFWEWQEAPPEFMQRLKESISQQKSKFARFAKPMYLAACHVFQDLLSTMKSFGGKQKSKLVRFSKLHYLAGSHHLQKMVSSVTLPVVAISDDFAWLLILFISIVLSTISYANDQFPCAIAQYTSILKSLPSQFAEQVISTLSRASTFMTGFSSSFGELWNTQIAAQMSSIGSRFSSYSMVKLPNEVGKLCSTLQSLLSPIEGSSSTTITIGLVATFVAATLLLLYISSLVPTAGGDDIVPDANGGDGGGGGGGGGPQHHDDGGENRRGSVPSTVLQNHIPQSAPSSPLTSASQEPSEGSTATNTALPTPPRAPQHTAIRPPTPRRLPMSEEANTRATTHSQQASAGGSGSPVASYCPFCWKLKMSDIMEQHAADCRRKDHGGKPCLGTCPYCQSVYVPLEALAKHMEGCNLKPAQVRPSNSSTSSPPATDFPPADHQSECDRSSQGPQNYRNPPASESSNNSSLSSGISSSAGDSLAGDDKKVASDIDKRVTNGYPKRKHNEATPTSARQVPRDDGIASVEDASMASSGSSTQLPNTPTTKRARRRGPKGPLEYSPEDNSDCRFLTNLRGYNGVRRPVCPSSYEFDQDYQERTPKKRRATVSMSSSAKKKKRNNQMGHSSA